MTWKKFVHQGSKKIIQDLIIFSQYYKDILPQSKSTVDFQQLLKTFFRGFARLV